MDYSSLYKFDAAVSQPQEMYVELTGGCNLKCPNCPRTYADSTRGNIASDLFEQVILSIAQDFPTLPELGFHFFGEIEMKKDFAPLIAWARPKLPQTRFSISTTLTLPRQDVVATLLDCGFNSIGIWPDGYDQQSYEKIRPGGDFATVKYNLQFLLEERDKRGLQDTEIHVGMVKNLVNQDYVPRFLEQFAFVNEYTNTTLNYVEAHDWAGQIPAKDILLSKSKYKLPIRRPCSMPFTTMVIDAEGTATLCCYDMNLQLAIGKFQTSGSVAALWRSPEAAAIRKSMQRLNPPDLCKNCHHFYLDATPTKLLSKAARKLGWHKDPLAHR